MTQTDMFHGQNPPNKTAMAMYYAASRGADVIISAKRVTRDGKAYTTTTWATPEGVKTITSPE